MALTINTNLFSLDTQKNLQNSHDPLAIAMQRLSSGLRINSAKDDAAGLAIATRMQRQVTGLSVAMRNANDGVSFAQTAEGTMTEMVNDLQRIYELANQSSSYNTSLDRGSMNQEVTQLISELNRVVTQTRYNGQQFLNQQFSANFQVGTEVNETINITTSNVSPNAFGVQSTRSDFTNLASNISAIASAVGSLTLRAGIQNGTALSTTATLAGISLGAAILGSLVENNSTTIINRVNQYTGQTNVTAFSFGNAYVATAIQAATATGTAVAVNAGFLSINGISIGSTANASGEASMASVLVTAINNSTAQTGVTAVVLGSADTGAASSYSIALVNTTGAQITVSVATANAGTAGTNVEFFGTTGGSIAAGQNGQVTFSTPLNTTSITTSTGSDTLGLGFGSGATTISISNAQSINNVNITTTGGASLAILAVEQGLETMNTQKAYLGAVINRFASTVRSISNVEENITAAKSRIMDADYAAETANLTKAMITQQAGISVLAQANQLPQQVLGLLGK